MSTIAYLTDVEGRWDKLATFAEGNPHVRLEADALRLADGVTFVFGGDAIDRGPSGRRVVSLLLAARRTYGDRVVLLAGNRDVNKLRLVRELGGQGPRGPLLKWILAHTMGAKDAFAHRATELGAEGRARDDEAVAESFLEDLAPGGSLRAYLAACQLAFRAGPTLFVHGAVTAESLGAVPGRRDRMPTLETWIEALNGFYADELHAFEQGREPAALIGYQAPLPGTRAHQASVIYGRLADEHGNPLPPDAATRARLRDEGVHRLVVGHTPSGDCPAIVREGGLELVLADNAYGRLERGSQVAIAPDRVEIAARTVLDDGTEASVRFALRDDDDASPLGRRDARTGHLVKARLDDGDYLLFRAHPGFRVEQTRARGEELVVPPRARATDA
jgi:hypothetical protein